MYIQNTFVIIKNAHKLNQKGRPQAREVSVEAACEEEDSQSHSGDLTSQFIYLMYKPMPGWERPFASWRGSNKKSHKNLNPRKMSKQKRKNNKNEQ